MKRNIAIALATLATLLSVHTATAQDVVAKANIPFSFTVGGVALPGGTYTVSAPLEHTLLIRSGSRQVMTVVNSFSGSDTTGAGGKLIFTRRGGQFFLRDVQSSKASIHARVPLPKLRKNEHSEVASLESDSTVVVALN